MYFERIGVRGCVAGSSAATAFDSSDLSFAPNSLRTCTWTWVKRGEHIIALCVTYKIDTWPPASLSTPSADAPCAGIHCGVLRADRTKMAQVYRAESNIMETTHRCVNRGNHDLGMHTWERK